MDNGLNDCAIIVMISVRREIRGFRKQLTESPESVGTPKARVSFSSEWHLKWD